MATTKARGDNRIREVTPEEGRELVDQAARKYLHMSGDEFLRRWDAGEFRDQDTPAVMRVASIRHLTD